MWLWIICTSQKPQRAQRQPGGTYRRQLHHQRDNTPLGDRILHGMFIITVIYDLHLLKVSRNPPSAQFIHCKILLKGLSSTLPPYASWRLALSLQSLLEIWWALLTFIDCNVICVPGLKYSWQSSLICSHYIRLGLHTYSNLCQLIICMLLQ